MKDRKSSGTSSKTREKKSASNDRNEKIIPFGEAMRRKRLKKKPTLTTNDPTSNKIGNSNDIDEEIRRLEADLEAGSDDSDDDSDSLGSDDSSESSSSSSSSSASSSDAKKPVGYLCLSSSSTEKIAPLPQNMLPTNKRRKIRGIDADAPPFSKKSKKNPKPQEHQVNQGLKNAVRELLQNYVPRSAERLPFYCRVCAHQSSDLDEFREHKRTDFHEVAVKEEKKATYCGVCRKQFTSLVQMKEHLGSKPHSDKMQSVTARQNGGGRKGGGQPQKGGKRQWS